MLTPDFVEQIEVFMDSDVVCSHLYDRVMRKARFRQDRSNLFKRSPNLFFDAFRHGAIGKASSYTRQEDVVARHNAGRNLDLGCLIFGAGWKECFLSHVYSKLFTYEDART